MSEKDGGRLYRIKNSVRPSMRTGVRIIQLVLGLVYLGVSWVLTDGDPVAWTVTGEEVIYSPWFAYRPSAALAAVFIALLLEGALGSSSQSVTRDNRAQVMTPWPSGFVTLLVAAIAVAVVLGWLP